MRTTGSTSNCVIQYYLFFYFLFIYFYSAEKCLHRQLTSWWTIMVFLSALSLLSLMFLKVSTQQCGIDSYSVYQRMLKGHTFKTVKARPLLLDCKEACTTDYRCQSYNYDWSQSICELNNRTREARPNDFVRNENRYYVREPHKGTNQITLT